MVDLKDDREDLKATVKEAQADRDEAKEAVGEIDSTLEAAREEQNRLEWEIGRASCRERVFRAV